VNTKEIKIFIHGLSTFYAATGFLKELARKNRALGFAVISRAR
jgi:hypothetical protein